MNSKAAFKNKFENLIFEVERKISESNADRPNDDPTLKVENIVLNASNIVLNGILYQTILHL